MKVANTAALAELHAKLAETLHDYMEKMDVNDEEQTGTNVQVLKLVSSFLKENNITSDLANGEGEDQTAKRLDEMHAKRRRVTLPTDHLMN